MRIQDVARHANVSVATVSRVLNESNKVSEETKNIVLATIKELDYTPNNLARNFRKSESKCILVFVDTISNEFYSQVVKGIEETTKGKYKIMLCMTHGDPETELEYCKLIKTKVVDGAIFLDTQNDGKLLDELLSNCTCVQASELNLDFNTTCITIDNKKAGYDATKFLIDKGYKTIAFLGSESLKKSSSELRYEGYLEALAENNIKISKKFIFKYGFDHDAGEKAAKKLLSMNTLPDVIFCTSDASASGVIKTLHDNGINVPSDIAVMGFDGTKSSEIYIPSISTVVQPRYEIGVLASEILMKQLENRKKTSEKIILEHKIINRQSTN